MFPFTRTHAETARRRVTTFALAVALAGMAACETPDDDDAMAMAPQDVAPEVTWLNTPETEAMGFPFSEAVRVGHMLYLSGQVGNLPGEAALVPGGIQAETRQTMENIKATLERYGSSMDRVVKCTVFIDDMAEWPAMNEVYAPYFPAHKPARSAVGADGLALGAAVEIECWATV
jgi:reactive intermediate/imine deaminase